MGKRFGGSAVAKKAYSNTAHGQDDVGGVPAFDRTINRRAGNIRLVLPGNTGRTYFMPFPALDPKNPDERLLPGRFSDQERAQNNWLVKVEAANYIGTPGHQTTFLCYHPDDARTRRQTNPYISFYYACNKAMDAAEFASGGAWDSKWNRLMRGSKKGGSAAIKKPGGLWYMQGAVFQHAGGEKVTVYGKDSGKPLGLGDGDGLPILRVSGMMGSSLMKLMDVREGDKFVNSVIGRVDNKKKVVEGGKILDIYKLAPSMELKDLPGTWDGKFPEKGGILGYEAYLRKSIKFRNEQYAAGLSTEDFERVLSTALFWWDQDIGDKLVPGVLYVGSDEEQMLWLAQAFPDVPKLVRFALADRSELFTDEVKAVLNKRVSSVNPKSSKSQDDDEDDTDDEDEEDEQPKKGKGKKKFAPKGKGRDDDDDEEDQDDEDDTDTDDDEDSDDDDDSDSDDSDDDDSDDDDDADSDDEEDEDDADTDDDDSDDEDEEDSGDEDEEDSGDEDSDDSDDDDSDDSDDDDSDDEESSAEDDEDDEDEEPKAKGKGKGKSSFGFDDESDTEPERPKKGSKDKGGKSKSSKDVGKVGDAKKAKDAINEAVAKSSKRKQGSSAKPPTSKGGSAKAPGKKSGKK